MPTTVHPPRTAVGPAHAHALVLAPVTPVWDEGAFFAPVIDTLTAAGAGLRVTVVDTLALRDERVRTLEDLVARWRALLPAFGRIDLLCGNALGGAVAQGLLPYVAPGTAALLVSGPARSDALLEHRLSEIADLAATGHTEASLALLHERVQPDGTPPSTGPDPTATAARTAAEGDAACRSDGAVGDLGHLTRAGTAPAAPGDTPAARTGVAAGRAGGDRPEGAGSAVAAAVARTGVAADGAGGDRPAGGGTAVGRAGGDRPVESHDGRAVVDGAVDGLGRLARADAAPAAPGRLVRGGTAPAVPADLPRPARQTPAQRLDGGLRLLCGIDLAAAVEAHPGPLLHIVGGRSQLVTRRHTAAGPHHRVHVVAEAGMRPHTDQPAEVSALIGAFLREKGLT
ncbi:hypothetical protein A4E84_21305 [Streptomyces qaidamensis]|uniref:Alpha/beta hydrolase n=1 Tax=Streptomyces qaidamensis TaxID=1783515 RepID=A0A143C337_9ACTN|nr:hypothetical protein [Streptomyces qaidamensis]AMW11812.1 hypothetical protein A4E84_21305 [Streptomyces qaidamensis]